MLLLNWNVVKHMYIHLANQFFKTWPTTLAQIESMDKQPVAAECTYSSMPSIQRWLTSELIDL